MFHSHTHNRTELNKFMRAHPTSATASGDFTAGFEAQPLAAADTAPASDEIRTALDGSWFLQFQPSNPTMNAAIRGPMRIESSGPAPLISGDIYVEPVGTSGTATPVIESLPAGSLVIDKNWYPAFPQHQYSWYFRSVETQIDGDALLVQFERHIWDTATSEFVQSDMGGLRVVLQPDPVAWPNLPQPALLLRGDAFIAGETIQVLAIKTSDFHRGCVIEVDVMENRRWPENATNSLGTSTFSFDQVFRDAGLDFITNVSETAISEDSSLSPLELHSFLQNHREPTTTPDAWRLWLFVGSSWQAGPGVFGIMFDSTPPHREGSVGFYDPRLPPISTIEASARGEKLGDVELAFLRTLIHEAGHAFNLYHPKADSHGVDTGTTVMNQTGDVIGFATPTNTYPSNASMTFNDHNRTALIHAPDPQTKPGWLRFGWGHDASISSGIPEPTGVMGLNKGTVPMADLSLDLDVPEELHRGEIVIAKLTLRNASDRPIEVSSALNLAEDDLDIVISDPQGNKLLPRDVVKICGRRETVELAPGEVVENAVQLFFNNGAFTFSETGRYQVWARFRPSADQRLVVESGPHQINVRNCVTRKEQDLEKLMLDDPIGLSVAFGDFGADEHVERTLKKVVSGYKDTETVGVCAMVLSNTLAREYRDVRSGEVCRKADKTGADSALDSALVGRSAKKTVELAMATVTPRYAAAPLLDLLQKRMAADSKKTSSDGGRSGALAMLSKVGMLA